MLFGGRVKVIQYEGPPDALVWQHPCEVFNTRTKLIVEEPQEVIFYRNGQASELVGAGMYELEKSSFAFLRRLEVLPGGGKHSFACKVYFINRRVLMEMPWGTDQPVVAEDARDGQLLSVRGYGDFSIRVKDGRTLLMSLAGTGQSLGKEDIRRKFQSMMSGVIRSRIANTLTAQRVCGSQIETKLLSMAAEMQALLQLEFDRFGLELSHFSIGAITVNGMEIVNERAIKKIRTGMEADHIRTLAGAQADAALLLGGAQARINDLQGISQKDKRILDITEKLVDKSAPAGGYVSAGTPETVPAASGAQISEVLSMLYGAPQPQSKAARSRMAAPESDSGRNEDGNRGRRSREELERWLDCKKLLYEKGIISSEEYEQALKKFMDGEI